MKEKITRAVEKYRDLILKAERDIWAMPETGYREEKTSAYLADKFRALGYELTMAGDIPGFITEIDTGREGPTLMILGELDSLIVPNHPECDPKTGYVHSCGHNVQTATLLGVAAALKEEGMLDGLSGKIRLCVVPAEELIEIGYRNELKRAGKIHYLGGKSEFMYRGLFDGVDLAFMVHASQSYGVSLGNVGCLAKTVHYKGVSAHAGGAPWNGKNALYAAMQGLNAVNALRETFKEEDMIRFHPIITHGGEAVNAIPELVTIETYVRGASFDAIKDANARINRALCGAALSIGAQVEIIDTPGYAPLHNNEAMRQLAKAAADEIIPEEAFQLRQFFSTGSTDMGDLCCVMPVIHPYSGGATGKSHGDDYRIEDAERACIKSAKFQIQLLRKLLENGGEQAKKIAEEYKPLFKTKEDYFAFVDKMEREGDCITYKENGCIEICLEKAEDNNETMAL
jgi:amidohydrolase